ncbi:MAG: response regulator [Bdellovibrionales bacterium]
MFKSDIKILLVEDNTKLGESLKEILNDQGYQVEWVKNPGDALQLVARESFHCAIIDVMLPQKSGVDLCVELQGTSARELKYFLMSGIYKDRTFVKDAKIKTKCIDYLLKPFDPEKLIEAVESAFSDVIVPELTAAEKLIYNSSYSKRDLVSALTETKSINGLELPFYLAKLLIHGIHCQIALTDGENQTSIVEIAHSVIKSVRVPDPKSVFGQLLVEMEYVTPEELEHALTLPSKKRIGEKLIDANLLSPHVIELVNSEQMANRLSLLVGNISYDLSFKEHEDVENKTSGIDTNLLNDYLEDWLGSKYEEEWFNAYYSALIPNAFVMGNKYHSNNPLMLNPVVMQIPDAKKQFMNDNSIAKILASHPDREHTIFQIVSFLYANDLVFFNASTKNEDLGVQLDRVSKILEAAATQDHFQVLGVPRGAKIDEVKKSYKDLTKAFHPDKLSANASEELKEKTNDLFSIISKAHEALENPESAAMYLKELEQGQAKMRLQQEALLDDAKDTLRQQNFKKANEMLEEAFVLCPPSSDLRLHLLWSRLKTVGKEDEEKLGVIGNELNKIPPEERHNAMYYFIKGLFMARLGEVKNAKSNIAHAVSIAPEFVDAKRELKYLELAADGKVDILNADLKDVARLLFKKRKR